MNNIFIKIGIIGLILPLLSTANAWDAYDAQTQNFVDIEENAIIIEDREIEYFDHATNTYKEGIVENVETYGYSTEIEIRDLNNNTLRILELDDF